MNSTPSDDLMAAFITRCTAALEEQLAKANGWPPAIRVPHPKNDAEREALALWTAELKQATGAAIQIKTADD